MRWDILQTKKKGKAKTTAHHWTLLPSLGSEEEKSHTSKTGNVFLWSLLQLILVSLYSVGCDFHTAPLLRLELFVFSSITTEFKGPLTYKPDRHFHNKTGYSSYSYFGDFSSEMEWRGNIGTNLENKKGATMEETAVARLVSLVWPCMATMKRKSTMMLQRLKLVWQLVPPVPLYITVLSNHFSSNVSESILSLFLFFFN